jgi:hypothetical protein
VNHSEEAPLLGGRGALSRFVATPAPAPSLAEESVPEVDTPVVGEGAR